MKKFLIAGSSLAAVAAAGSAGAVDVTLGGSIELGFEFGIGKGVDNLMTVDGTSVYQAVTLSLAAAGTTDAGMKFGGSFGLSTADELELGLYGDDGAKKLVKLTNSEGEKNINGAAYNVSGGAKIDATQIVSVKINSEWKSVSNNTRTVYSGNPYAFATSNICKIAGKVQGAQGNGTAFKAFGANLFDDFVDGTVENINGTIQAAFTVVRDNIKGTKITDLAEIPATHGSGYLPAGRLLGEGDAPDGNDGVGDVIENLALTLGTTNAQSKKIHVVLKDDDALPAKGGKDTDKFWIALNDATSNKTSIIKATSSEAVDSAQVYAGPFMSVKLQSSTTKLAVGAVCVTGKKTTSTYLYNKLASNAVTASGAKIYVEGGFGKVTLQTGDYAGKVSAIGDAADLASNGIVAIIDGNFMGLNAYAALTNDWVIANDGATGSWIAGATMDLGGLAVAIDMSQSKTTYTNVVVNKDGDKDIEKGEHVTISQIETDWDLGMAYSAGDLSASAAIDSDGDWGVSAATSVAGISVDAKIYNKALSDHKKGGLMYDITGGMAVNSLAVGLSYDQDGDVGFTVGYDIGELNVYAGYASGDEGGKIGAKLSF